MDSEWVGRAGILAEAVSFLLIAPEIIGEDRLRRAEAFLEAFATDFMQSMSRPADEDQSPSLPPMLKGLALVLLPAVPWAGGAYLAFLWRTDIFVMLSAWMGISLTWALASILLKRTPSPYYTIRFMNWGRSCLVDLCVLAPHLLTYMPILLLFGFVMPLSLTLLAGDDRLRALVFGTGVVLLFGGLATQFYATF